MPFSTDLISQAVDRYRRERDRYVKLADRVAEICRSDICEQNAIRAQVTFRVKSLKSFEGKLRRYSTDEDRNYKSVEDIFSATSDPTGVGDLAGVRIAAYQFEDCQRLIEHLKQNFRGPVGEIEIDQKDRNHEDPRNFYRAIHAQVSLSEEELIGVYDNVDDISCEIQICTMIAHVWNEVHHDIGYKPEHRLPSEDELRLLQMLGHTVRAGDEQISMLLTAYARQVNREPQLTEQDSRKLPFRDVHDFVSRMRDYKNQAMPNFARNSGQVFDLLEALKLNTPLALEEALETFEPEELREETKRFILFLQEKDLSASVPDKESSDLMLMRLFNVMLDEILEVHRDKVGRGKGRPTRLYRLARKYKEYSGKTSD